jgi:hypothetical protein
MSDPARPDEPEKSQESREFASFLLQHAKGRSHDELTRSLAEVVRAVVDTDKPGAITFTVKIKPAGNVEGMVKVEDSITTKVPQLDRPATMFFVSDEGELSLDHPNQTAMFTIGGQR